MEKEPQLNKSAENSPNMDDRYMPEDRIKGLHPSLRGLASDLLQNKFDHGENFITKEERSFVKEKTEEDFQIINLVNDSLHKMQAEYGIKQWNMPEDNVLFIEKPEGYISDKNAKNYKRIRYALDSGSSMFSSTEARIYINTSSMQSKSELTNVYFHESIHASMAHNLIKALLEKKIRTPIAQDKTESSDYEQKNEEMTLTFLKCGIGSISKKRKIGGVFQRLNEAITEELAARKTREIIKENKELFGEEYDALNISKNLKDDHLTTKSAMVRKKNDGQFVPLQAYNDERALLYFVIDLVYKEMKKSPEKFSKIYNTQEDIFQEFAKSTISGNPLKIARMIKKTLGKKALDTIALTAMQYENWHDIFGEYENKILSEQGLEQEEEPPPVAT